MADRVGKAKAWGDAKATSESKSGELDAAQATWEEEDDKAQEKKEKALKDALDEQYNSAKAAWDTQKALWDGH